MKINKLLENLDMFTILIFANTGFSKKFPFVEVKDEIFILNGNELIGVNESYDNVERMIKNEI